MEPKLDDTQCGFSRGHSTTEQISTPAHFREILGLGACQRRIGYTCFVDLGKVYGPVPRKKLWGVNRSALVLTPTMWCAVAPPLHSLYQGSPNYVRRPKLTCEAILPGGKTHFANNEKIIFTKNVLIL